MHALDIMLLLYPMINNYGNLVLASFKNLYKFLLKNQWHNNPKSNLRNPRIELTKTKLTLAILCRIGIMMQIWSFCLKKVYLSLLGYFLSFSSKTNFLFSIASTLKLSKDGEWLQSNKWLITALPLCLNFSDEILICSPILTWRCLAHSP